MTPQGPSNPVSLDSDRARFETLKHVDDLTILRPMQILLRIGILPLVSTLLLVACTPQSEEERIREFNEAILNGVTADSDKVGEKVHYSSLRNGHCFNGFSDPGLETVKIEKVDLVACSSSWQYRVIDSFLVGRSGIYPGEEYFDREAFNHCDRHGFLQVFPLRESWDLGDRAVLCLQESYGLSTSDPDRLERIVSQFSLRDGECFKETPDFTELVSCSSDWEYKVINTFAVDLDGIYPGEPYFDQEAAQRCHASSSTYMFPAPASWTWGDRTVNCLQEH